MPGLAFEGATELVSDAGRLRSWARHTWRFYSANTCTPMRQAGRLRPWREELIFTPDKVLGRQPDRRHFILGFPQLSTRKSPRPQLLHKRGMFFYCGMQPSAAEWVQRKRWNLSTLAERRLR